MASPLQVTECRRANALILGSVDDEIKSGELIEFQRGHIFLYVLEIPNNFHYLKFKWEDNECNLKQYSYTDYRTVVKDLEKLSSRPLIIRAEQDKYKYSEITPETQKLAQEALARQAEMTDEDRKRAIEQIVNDIKNAND